MYGYEFLLAETAGRCFKRPAAVPLGLLGLLQYLSSLRANSKILGETCSAEFDRRPAPAEKTNRSITPSAPAAAGDREIFYEQRNGSRKLMFSPTQGGGETHVFSGEARQRSFSPRRKYRRA